MINIMDFLDDWVLGPMNLIDRLTGLLYSAKEKDLGYRMAIPRCDGDKGGEHTLNECEAILETYGVAIFSRTHDARNMYFKVKKRQAKWAEYLLLHAGVELVSQTVDNRNEGYAATKEAGWMPTPWGDR